MLVVLYTVAALAAVRGMWSPCGMSMLSALNPVAERARGHRFWVTACWYLLGAAAGGALLGLGCAAGAAAVSALHPGSTLVWLLALAGGLVATASDMGTGWSLPDQPRQVDERWLVRYRRWLYAAGYGVQIGAGFATYIMTAAVYLVALLAVLTTDPTAAFTAGLVFGVVRGACIGVAGLARDPDRLRTLLGRIDASAGASAAVAGAACAGVAVVAASALGGVAGAGGAAVALSIFAVACRSRARRASFPL